jgi:hypothetical protein
MSKKSSLFILALGVLVIAAGGCSRKHFQRDDSFTFITFSRIDKAWALSKGQNVRVAVVDWQFNLKGKAAEKYVCPTSLVPGEEIGKLKPWHGEWMAEIVHQVAPEAKIIPLNARSIKDSDKFEEYLIKGIRFAADQGAVAVTSSMGQIPQSAALREAVDFAEARGAIFVDVHPEYIQEEGQKPRAPKEEESDARIIHTGIVSVPLHPVEPKATRDVYTWPYDLEASYEDGWGYSNAPPIVAGVIALMKSANPALTTQQVRDILKSSAYEREGFRVLDAEAAVKAALAVK